MLENGSSLNYSRLTRYDTSGTLTGQVTIPTEAPFASFPLNSHLGQDSSGRYYVAGLGTTSTLPLQRRGMIARVTGDLVLDLDWDPDDTYRNGIRAYDLGDARGFNVSRKGRFLFSPTGQIVLAASAQGSGGTQGVVLRLNGDSGAAGPSPTATPTPSATPTTTPTSTPTPLPTATPTSTPTATPVPTTVPTSTPVPSVVPSPTLAPTPSPTAAPTATPRPSPTPAVTPPPGGSSGGGSLGLGSLVLALFGGLALRRRR